MPAKSTAEQGAAGAALAYKRGETSKSELGPAAKKMAHMTIEQLREFAGTKHKGLPKHVKK